MNRKWNEYRKILKIIGKYYSREQYGSPEYLHSKEYKRYKKILEDKALFKKKQKEYYDMLCKVFPNYYVKRWDNMTYPCIQFSILLHKDQPILDDDVELMDALGGKRYDLDIFISRISNYYYAYTSESMYMLDGELRETQTANYFSDVYPIDCTVSPANALFCRKNGTLLQAGNLL